MDQDLTYKSLLAKYKVDISQDIIDFVNSQDFVKFEKIIEQVYLAKLEDFQNEIEINDILVGQKVLNIYSNLPVMLKLMEQNILQQRRDAKEKD